MQPFREPQYCCSAAATEPLLTAPIWWGAVTHGVRCGQSIPQEKPYPTVSMLQASFLPLSMTNCPTGDSSTDWTAISPGQCASGSQAVVAQDLCVTPRGQAQQEPDFVSF